MPIHACCCQPRPQSCRIVCVCCRKPVPQCLSTLVPATPQQRCRAWGPSFTPQQTCCRLATTLREGLSTPSLTPPTQVAFALEALTLGIQSFISKQPACCPGFSLLRFDAH